VRYVPSDFCHVSSWTFVALRYSLSAGSLLSLTFVRERVVDEVLVCAGEVVVDYPVEIAFGGCEFHIDPVRAGGGDCGGRPVEVGCSAVWTNISYQYQISSYIIFLI
jgi:hypothetical protein